jgi:hypothetical protein
MIDFIYRSFVLDDVSWFLLLSMTAVSVYMLHVALENAVVTFVALPVMVFGGALAQNAAREFNYIIVQDKVVNGSIAMGSGLFAAGVLLILVMSIWSALTAD